jgi:hypothetical protein
MKRFALACILAAGCAPTTNYRYTGLVPAARPLAWDGRTAPAGSLRLEGAAEFSTIHENLTPQIHDTALHIPNATLEGAAMIAIVPGFELGGRFAYSPYEWSQESAVGTLPLLNDPAAWGIGPEMHVTVPLDHDERWALGIAANVMNYQVPYAKWQLNMGCTPSPTCIAGYTLVEQKSEGHVTLNLAAYPSVSLGKRGELGHVFGGLSAHTGFKNDGFTDMAQNGSGIQDAGLIFVLGAGYGVNFQNVLASAMLALPLTSGSSPVNYGVGGFVTVGTAIELWEQPSHVRAAGDAP